MSATDIIDMTPIRGLCAGLIAREEFPTRQWFYASPLWYYHRARQGQVPTKLSQDFYKLVDRELKPLCLLLHSHDLQTTPSCQGHFYPQGHFRRVWNTIRRECELIRGIGLQVRDAETGRFHLFQDSGYRLPWNGFEAFYEDARTQRGCGYLGVWATVDFIEALRAVKTPHSCIRLHVARHAGQTLPLITMLVSARSPTERTQAWAWLTRAIESIL